MERNEQKNGKSDIDRERDRRIELYGIGRYKKYRERETDRDREGWREEKEREKGMRNPLIMKRNKQFMI